MRGKYVLAAETEKELEGWKGQLRQCHAAARAAATAAAAGPGGAARQSIATIRTMSSPRSPTTARCGGPAPLSPGGEQQEEAAESSAAKLTRRGPLLPRSASRRERLLAMATVCEKAGMAEDAAKHMMSLAKAFMPLEPAERSGLARTVKKVVGVRRAAWRAAMAIEVGQESLAGLVGACAGQPEGTAALRAKIEGELGTVCGDMLLLLDGTLLPAATDNSARLDYMQLQVTRRRLTPPPIACSAATIQLTPAPPVRPTTTATSPSSRLVTGEWQPLLRHLLSYRCLALAPRCVSALFSADPPVACRRREAAERSLTQYRAAQGLAEVALPATALRRLAIALNCARWAALSASGPVLQGARWGSSRWVGIECLKASWLPCSRSLLGEVIGHFAAAAAAGGAPPPAPTFLLA